MEAPSLVWPGDGIGAEEELTAVARFVSGGEEEACQGVAVDVPLISRAAGRGVDVGRGAQVAAYLEGANAQGVRHVQEGAAVEGVEPGKFGGDDVAGHDPNVGGRLIEEVGLP